MPVVPVSLWGEGVYPRGYKYFSGGHSSVHRARYLLVTMVFIKHRRSDLESVRGVVEEVRSTTGASSKRVRCPECGPERRKQNEKTLSLTFDREFALFFCHHCEIHGRIDYEEGVELDEVTSEPSSGESLCQQHVEWLRDSRGISEATARDCGLVSGEVYIRSRSREVLCVGFRYDNEDGSHAVKWRDGGKNFTQTGSARSLWRIEKFSGGDLVICEGELDALSFEEAGIFATSVPNGAPSGEVKGSAAKKFSYLWGKVIEGADRIILATDMDGPGRILSEEIARRVGKARCWNVRFPEGCKDANDLLVRDGKEALVECLKAATPWPISGLRDPSEYREDAVALFNGGFKKGHGSGIPEVDEIYRVLPQTLTICTGIPGSGKSAFLTWLSVILARDHEWNCAVLSAETSSEIHMLQMAAAYMGKPYMGESRMTEDELSVGLDWVSERFVFIDESDTDITSVLDRAHAAVLRNGVRLLMVDPYNFLTGTVGQDDPTGVAHINSLLIALKGFAVERGIAVWLVAHPTKMYRSSDGSVPVPVGYDISGSSAFYNVADSGLTLSRDGEGKSKVTCWKARFPWIGRPGEASVKFNPNSGVFSGLVFGWEGGEFDESFLE